MTRLKIAAIALAGLIAGYVLAATTRHCPQSCVDRDAMLGITRSVGIQMMRTGLDVGDFDHEINRRYAETRKGAVNVNQQRVG